VENLPAIFGAWGVDPTQREFDRALCFFLPSFTQHWSTLNLEQILVLRGKLLVSFIECSTAGLFGCLNNHFVSLCKLAENKLHHFQMMFSSPTDPLLGGYVVSG